MGVIPFSFTFFLETAVMPTTKRIDLRIFFFYFTGINGVGGMDWFTASCFFFTDKASLLNRRIGD